MNEIQEVPKKPGDRPEKDVTIVDCGTIPVEEPYAADY